MSRGIGVRPQRCLDSCAEDHAKAALDEATAPSSPVSCLQKQLLVSAQQKVKIKASVQYFHSTYFSVRQILHETEVVSLCIMILNGFFLYKSVQVLSERMRAISNHVFHS